MYMRSTHMHKCRCGHCKKLAPVLDSAAPKLTGQMSIGTIDCTQDKKLCDSHKVRGYPTLKFSLDGEIYPYEGGRTERDLIEFAARVMRPVVELVEHLEAASGAMEKSDNGVAFLAFHPALSKSSSSTSLSDDATSLEEKLQSTHMTQVFAQVARKQRATATFLLLDSTMAENDESAVAMAAEMGQNGQPFVCRIEANVASRCFQNISNENMNWSDLLSWVVEQNVAIVSHLGPGNFQKIGRRGRPLVIAAVIERKPEDVAMAKRQLAAYATTGPVALRDKYYYGWLDGQAWHKFLGQFDVFPIDLPQVFVVDVPRKAFWQNATYELNVGDFLQAIQDGTIPTKYPSQQGLEGRLAQFSHLMRSYFPWSAIVAVLLLFGLVAAVVWCITPGEDLRPPYTRQPKPMSSTNTTTAKGSSSTKEAVSEEPKKEK